MAVIYPLQVMLRRRTLRGSRLDRASPSAADSCSLRRRKQLLKRCGSYVTRDASRPEARAPPESRGDMTTASKACCECGMPLIFGVAQCSYCGAKTGTI